MSRRRFPDVAPILRLRAIRTREYLHRPRISPRRSEPPISAPTISRFGGLIVGFSGRAVFENKRRRIPRCMARVRFIPCAMGMMRFFRHPIVSSADSAFRALVADISLICFYRFPRRPHLVSLELVDSPPQRDVYRIRDNLRPRSYLPITDPLSPRHREQANRSESI